MPTILKTKNSVTTTVVPTTLQQGELAVNITDKKLWVGNAATTPVQLLGAGVTGDVVGPASATDNAISRFDGTTGKLIQNSLVTVSDTGAISAPVDASISGLTVGKGGGAVSTNTAVGLAMNATATGGGNAAFGYGALYVNTTGSENTAVGDAPLRFNTTGANNTAIGSNALNSNTTASNNTAVGYRAGYANVTGALNAYFGTAAGENATGSNNSYFGGYAGAQVASSTGSSNSGFGYFTLAGITSGANNTAVGQDSLRSNTTASFNTAVGYQAAYGNTTGAYNAAFGQASFNSNTTGSYNTALGAQSLASNTTSSFSTVVGYQAGYSHTSGGGALTAVGYQAGFADNESTGGAFFGYQSAVSNTTGEYNSGFGTYSLRSNTTGSSNTAVGLDSLRNNTTSSNNVVVGYQAGYSHTGTTGKNALFGSTAGYSLTSGGNNTFIGTEAGYSVTTGTKNTIIGQYNGNLGGLDIRTASNWVVLSEGDGNIRAACDNNGRWRISGLTVVDSARISVTYDANDSIGIGIKQTTSSGTMMNFWNSANSSIGSITASNTNISYNTSSDYRLKENILPMTSALATVAQLKPVTYKWKSDGSDGQGFIAHELAEVCPDAVTGEKDALDKDGNPKYQGIDTSYLVATLTAAIQELKAEFDAYKATHP
jgi:hypothetical protein